MIIGRVPAGFAEIILKTKILLRIVRIVVRTIHRRCWIVTQKERRRGTTRKVGVVVSIAAAAATRIEDREGTEKETHSSDHQSQRNTIVLLLC